MTTELRDLAAIRLERDWTYEELAQAIGGVRPSTIHRLLTTPNAKPNERTGHKIRQFLDRVRRAQQVAS